MKRILYTLVMTTALSGCIPRYATIRPHYEVDVRNPAGEPLPTAMMWVSTGRSPPGYYPAPEEFRADRQGHIDVEKKSQWENMIFFLHGTNFYSWGWCIEAPGYLPRSGRGDEIVSPVILTPTTQDLRCRQAHYADEYLSPEHQ